MRKKYLLIPGQIKTENGDIRYIGPNQLAILYGVKLDECVIYDCPGNHDLIKLKPQSDGNYVLPPFSKSERKLVDVSVHETKFGPKGQQLTLTFHDGYTLNVIIERHRTQGQIMQTFQEFVNMIRSEL